MTFKRSGGLTLHFHHIVSFEQVRIARVLLVAVAGVAGVAFVGDRGHHCQKWKRI
jgi:hypothetical protein